MIRRHYNIDPATLTDDDWAKLYKEYEYTETIRLKNLKQIFIEALTKVVNEAFG